ncbi:MAG: PilZ domain-containing protein [Deltaproteobacteria bacterium]|nr:PilZ domain-containing protein [Deltaproteobacteria bacterium]
MERREDDRSACRTAVRVVHEEEGLDDFFELDSTNISPSGVFLCTDLLFPVGETMALEFAVPGRSHPVRSQGKVVRVVIEDDDVPGPGIALELEGLEGEDRTALARLSARSVRRNRGVCAP